jgi:formate dehydrogenase major subunit
MKKLRININGKEVIGHPSQTILDVATENGIFIPTFCYDERTHIHGACGICVVEVEGMPKLMKACATEIADGFVIKTDTARVKELRKTNLELLLSDHIGDCVAPCTLACPAHTGCQGYVGLIANGKFEEAISLIKDSIPLPGALGRVCPHPCEDVCRRKLVDEPISIQWLKRFASDQDLGSDDPFMPNMAPFSGKKVAIVGGGPLGLSAAFFLRKEGHDVTIFEAMPKMGGMLRYGIPEYRLPKELLDEEIFLIEKMGVKMLTNTNIGKDVKFDSLRKDYDAVLVGIGAWLSTEIGCPGEDAKGVIGGIDFLRKVVRNEEIKLGQNVAIVGGGNTAMDACRTAIRLGAKNVYNIYRRTKDEMPADNIEIVEAEEEGVIFKNLTNPLEIIKDKNGNVKQVRLQKMELGEPDASGRRSPKAIPGAEEIIDIDTMIVAIGQAVDPTGLDGLMLTKKNGIVGDEDTFSTNIDGVFVGGDCFNDKITIAIEAIGHAKKASAIIDNYLAGERVKFVKPYGVERTDLTEEDFEDRERKLKSKMDHLHPEDRKDNFSEVVQGFDIEAAIEEGKRCLECGCHDFYECKLVDFANEYDVAPSRISGDINKVDYEDTHPFIQRDPNKCIVCGLCVRVCDEVMGIGALGLVNRGFETIVKPTMERPLAESGCISCGQCISVCPTGALGERLSITKPVPLPTEETDTTCSFCSIGCSLNLETYGGMLYRAVADRDGVVNHGLSCGKGKFGFDCFISEGKLLDPMVKKNGQFEFVDYHEAFMLTAKKAQSIGAKYGKDKVAVSISDRYTNEEAYTIKKFADSIGAKTLCFNNRTSGIEKVLNVNASPNTMDELSATDLIIVAGFARANNPVMILKLRAAAENGAKVIVINPGIEEFDYDFAFKTLNVKNDIIVLKEIAKALLDAGKVSKAEGFDDFKNSLNKVSPSEDAKEVADLYIKAKRAMIVFAQNAITTDAATLIADIAVLSGHIGKARDGILQIKSKNNSQGIIDLGITGTADDMEGVKALLVFGEDPDFDTSKLEFLMVSDTHMTKTGEKADVIIPGTSYGSTDGTFTNTERRLLAVRAAIDEDVPYSNFEIAAELAHVFEVEMPFDDVTDIVDEMECNLEFYRYSELNEIYGGVLCENVNAKFVTVGEGKFADQLKNTDQLMNMISAKLPKPVRQKSVR